MKDNNDSKTETTVLNERQQRILAEQNLPTSYSELTSSQQRAIVAIEEMLQIVEEKYGIEFAYAGYVAANSLEEEHLTAYPVTGNRETDCFTVTKTTTGGVVEYSDDYMNIAVREMFVGYITETAAELLHGDGVKVYADITRAELNQVPEQTEELDGNIDAGLWIFIDGGEYDQESVSSFDRDFEAWMTEHEIYGSVQVISLIEGKFAYLTQYNYTDYLTNENYISRDFIYLNH